MILLCIVVFLHQLIICSTALRHHALLSLGIKQLVNSPCKLYVNYSKMFAFYSSTTTVHKQRHRAITSKLCEIPWNPDHNGHVMVYTHILTNICSKTHKLKGLMYMYRQFHLCKPETALKLYKAFIRPCTYGICLNNVGSISL